MIHKFGSDIQKCIQLLLKICLQLPLTHVVLTTEPLFEWHPLSSLARAAISLHLFVLLGCLHTHTKRLCALVALWTGKAVETWIGVDAALSSAHFVTNIRHHVTLKEAKI